MGQTPKQIVDDLIQRLFDLAGKPAPSGQLLSTMQGRIKRDLREAVKACGAGIPHTRFNEIFG